MTIENNPLLQKCIHFSPGVIRYVEHLEEHKNFVMAKQLLRYATSIGANAMESQSAESKADFIHKLKIADKKRTIRYTGFGFAMNLTAIRRIQNCCPY